MRYRISGKQIDVGDALQTHVKSELGETVEKYSQRPTDAIVIFSRDAHEFICEATVHLSTGLTATAKGNADRDLCRLRSVPRKDGQTAAPLQAPAEGPSPRPHRTG